MKILRLYYKLPPMKGGMEKHIYFLTKFQNISDEVTIFFNQGDAISSNDEKILPWIKLYKIKPLFVGVFIFYFFIIFKLLFSRKKFDSIHIHGDWSTLVFIQIIKKLTQSKVVSFTSHGIITNNFQHSKLLPMTLKNVDLIFTTGHESAEVLQKLVNKKVIVQPSGIISVFFEPPFFEPSNNTKFQVITVANLVPVKNLILVVEIAREMSDIDFLIVGEGTEKSTLLKSIQNYGLDNIKLVGYKTPNEIKKIYDVSNCFLLTSVAEGTSTAVLEAMACGLPIISSNAGGLDKIIVNDVNGVIINNFDKNNFIVAIDRIKEDNNLRDTISNNNRKLAENFRWEMVANRITQLVKETLHGEN
jgi:glycosyltransferase involved in cell wall biosynthesis